MLKLPPIVEVEVDRLVEPAKNPNRMEADEYDLLAAAIRKAGFLQPVLVREYLPEAFDEAARDTIQRLGGGLYRIVDGVHRVRAARDNGYTRVPCVVLDRDVDEDTVAALQIAMNRLRGELNLADVAKTLLDLQAHDWSVEAMTLTGLTESEVTDLLKTTRATVDDILENADLGSSGPPADEPDPEAGTFPLEVVFASEGDRKRARKALRKAAGKGNGLGVGLLRILDGDAD